MALAKTCEGQRAQGAGSAGDKLRQLDSGQRAPHDDLRPLGLSARVVGQQGSSMRHS